MPHESRAAAEAINLNNFNREPNSCSIISKTSPEERERERSEMGAISDCIVLYYIKGSVWFFPGAGAACRFPMRKGKWRKWEKQELFHCVCLLVYAVF